MALTQAQKATLVAHIRANTDPEVVTALGDELTGNPGRSDTDLARIYNEDSAFYVWRSVVPPSEYKNAIDWTEVDALTVGKARIWEWVTANMTENLDATDANIRKGISDAFSGSPVTLAALVSLGKTFASIYESVFATGNGTQGSPGAAVVVGPVTIQDLGRAFNENPLV